MGTRRKKIFFFIKFSWLLVNVMALDKANASGYYNLGSFWKFSKPAIAYVQSTGKTEVTPAATMTATFPSAPTVGNVIIVYAWAYSGTSTPLLSASDNISGSPNTYTPACNKSNANDNAAILWAPVNGTSGTFTVTVTSSQSDSTIVMVAVEYKGLSVSSPLDKTATATGSSNTPGTGTTALTTSAAELIAIVMTQSSSVSSIAAGGTYTARASELDGSASQEGAAADKIVASTSTYSGSWTTTGGSSAHWDGCIATFH